MVSLGMFLAPPFLSIESDPSFGFHRGWTCHQCRQAGAVKKVIHHGDPEEEGSRFLEGCSLAEEALIHEGFNERRGGSQGVTK